MTAFDILNEAHEMGLTLRVKVGGRLGYKPERLCPPEFRNRLLEYKPQLVPLLKSKGKTWIEVYSERLGETIFFCEDEETRQALKEAGASEWSIYTKDELRILVAHNRIAPLTDQELRTLRSIKSAFNARVTE